MDVEATGSIFDSYLRFVTARAAHVAPLASACHADSVVQRQHCSSYHPCSYNSTVVTGRGKRAPLTMQCMDWSSGMGHLLVPLAGSLSASIAHLVLDTLLD